MILLMVKQLNKKEKNLLSTFQIFTKETFYKSILADMFILKENFNQTLKDFKKKIDPTQRDQQSGQGSYQGNDPSRKIDD